MTTKSMLAIALVLLSAIMSSLYLSEQMRTESESENSAILADFSELNRIHSSIEKDLLRLHANKISNFDSVTKLQSQQRSTLASLKSKTTRLSEKDNAPLSALLAQYQTSYEKTIPLIDRYKRNTAFTKNSLNYSTHLTQQILEKLSGEAHSELKEQLNQLVADLLQYLISNSAHNEKNITAHIKKLQTHLVNSNHPATKAFETLSKHLFTILKGKKAATTSLSTILSSPHPQQLETSYLFYLEKEQSVLKKHQLYSNLSFFCILLLALFILRSIYKLITNTGKLTQEKAQLEESVTENRESLQQTNQQLRSEIEQRAQAEDELKNANIFYQNCIEGVLICDRDKKTISVNPAYSAITGITTENIMGKIPTIFDAAKLAEGVYEEISSTVESTGKWFGEVNTANADGGKTFKEVSIISLKRHSEIYRYIVIITDISERKKNEETIYLQANYDPLTQLPNRNLFNERAEHTLVRARRNKNKFATLFIDLDNFKKINDNLGHTIGDELLIELALRLRDSVRETDTVSRFGGDEFIIIIDNLDYNHDLKIIIDKFIHCLSTPVITSAETLHISGSIGISIYPDDGTDISTLIRCADMSMYKAKEQGKNTYCFFEEKMNAEVHEYLSMENQLRSAISNKELFLEYQPIIISGTETVYATEALVRWNRSSEGRVPPDKFIPIAEESGLIVPIGEWILRTACQRLSHWNQCINSNLKMSINISTLQFKDHGFDNMLNRVIAETEVNPNNLNLEITESLFLEDSDSHIFTTLHKLRAQGISISLDDFGTGYSSLSYLKRFPVNVLKIDRSFVNDVTDNPSDQLLIKAIINMAEGLNIKVVAEGVENPEQHELLSEYRCDYIQAYHFSAPKPADEIQHLLSSQQSEAANT